MINLNDTLEIFLSLLRRRKKWKSVIIDELKTLQIIDGRKMARINNSLIRWSGCKEKQGTF